MVLQRRVLLDETAPNRSTGIINGKSSNVLNWDDVRYPWANKMYRNLLKNFWTPFEISMAEDRKQWIHDLTDAEREAYAMFTGLLASLDSVQTDFVGRVSDFFTDSSCCAISVIIAQQEVVHNHSYSYMLSTLVDRDKQNEIFNLWKTNPVLKRRNDFVFSAYFDLFNDPTPENLLKAIVHDIILEGLSFYSAFVFFYNLARNNKMMASSKMINYINRDEKVHVGFFTLVFREILKENPELNTPELAKYVVEEFKRAVELELNWANYVIGNKITGITMADVERYVTATANTRVHDLGFEPPFPKQDLTSMMWVYKFEDPNESNTDRFQVRATSYAKVSDSFDDLD